MILYKFFGFVIAKLLYNSLCLYKCQSVHKAIGEMWFSQLLFKIDGWFFVKIPYTQKHPVCNLLQNMDFKIEKRKKCFEIFYPINLFSFWQMILKSPCAIFCFSLLIDVIILVLLRLYCEKLKANKAVIDQFITTKKVGLWMLDR